MDACTFRHEVMGVVRQVNQEAIALMRPLVERYGLTMTQMQLLMFIRGHNGMRVGDLAREMDLASGNASNLCKRLERDGLLQRNRSERDERIVRLVLTERGQEIVDQVERSLMVRFTRCFESEPPETFERLLDSLKQMVRVLQNIEQMEEEEEILATSTKGGSNL